jgi:hypothetical protein
MGELRTLNKRSYVKYQANHLRPLAFGDSSVGAAWATTTRFFAAKAKHLMHT